MPSWIFGGSGSGSFWMQFPRLVVILSSLSGLVSGFSGTDVSAHDLMSKYPLIDGHNDLALKLRILHNNRLSQINLHNVSKLATDISRLRAGHVQAQMFAAYVVCQAQNKDAVMLTLEQIDVIRRMCTEYEDLELFVFKRSSQLNDDDIKTCLISVEGGHSIDSSLSVLRTFYQLGVRSIALTHTLADLIVFKCVFQAVVEEMNRLGMIVDLSHSSWDTAKAALKISKAPVIFSHSSSYSICNHISLTLFAFEIILLLFFHFGFTDHFDHIKRVIGAESVGIGGDYEGAANFPQGLEDVSKYPALIQELLLRNWREDELAGVLRMNFLRVFEEVERVRDELSGTLPSEVQISPQKVQNACRLDLSHLRGQLRGHQSHTPTLPRAHHGPLEPQSLLVWATVLLICSLLPLY
uniref:Dipeptidase n=1 Tax=Myripristis murdjan TaxID=586833 RepID=A0A668ALV0_9TELE